MYYSRLKFVLLCLVLVACQKSSQPQAVSQGSFATIQIAQITGSWKLASALCNDKTIDLRDLTEVLSISGNVMSVQDSSALSQCQVTSSLYLTQSGINVFSSQVSAPRCSVNPTCNIVIGINGYDSALSCPQNFTPFLNGLVSYYIQNSTMVRTVDSGSESCAYTYSLINK